MRKLLIILSLIAGLLYGLKVSFYFDDYDGLIIVAFIVFTPLILSTIIADFMNHLKKDKRKFAFPRLISHFVVSIVILFSTVHAVNYFTEFIYNQKKMSDAEIVIKSIKGYQTNYSELPEGLYQLKLSGSTNFIYQKDEKNRAFKLSYVSSKSVYDSKDVNYTIYESDSKEWTTTTKSSKLGF